MTRDIALAALAFVSASIGPPAVDAQSNGAPPVEDIFIARSWRESRSTPTDFCTRAAVGFTNVGAEDRYSFRSVVTRAADGRVVDANAGISGSLRACFGSTSDSSRTNFYAEGTLANVTFVGRGECDNARRDFPEVGIAAARCFLELSNLPPPYIGGQLTTNTILSRALIGEQSDPAGYTQPSIATVRLWRRR